MIRYSVFKEPYQYFHLNFDFNTFPQFKSLDWNLISHQLNHCQKIWPSLEFHALVMLDTHTHLLFRISDQAENYFTEELLRRLELKRSHYQDEDVLVEPITQFSQYLNVYKYIYRNPVEAGIVLQCEYYPYSSLSSLLGKSVCPIAIQDEMNVIQNPYRILRWLNSDTHLKQSYLKDLRHENSASK